MSDFRFKDGAPPSEAGLRTRQLATFNGRDVVECICAVMGRDVGELRWWEYMKEGRRAWMWIPQMSCFCHGSGWVCANCGGAGWVLSQNDKGYTKAVPCAQCRYQVNGNVCRNDWALALADLRIAAEQVAIPEANWSAQ